MSNSGAALGNSLVLNYSDLYCYFHENASQIPISCTVYLTSIGKTVTAQTKIASYVPQYRWPKHALGTAELSGTTLRMWNAYYTFDNGAPSGVWGIWWGLRVQTPSPFSGGGWEYVQKIRPGRRRLTMQNVWQQCSLYGVWALDNTCPYPGSGGDSPPYSCDDVEHASGDRPQDDAGGFRQLQIDESFQTYSMYQPPDNGVGTTWIAIHEADWQWAGTASLTSTGTYAASGLSQGIQDLGYFMDQPQWGNTLVNATIWPSNGGTSNPGAN